MHAKCPRAKSIHLEKSVSLPSVICCPTCVITASQLAKNSFQHIFQVKQLVKDAPTTSQWSKVTKKCASVHMCEIKLPHALKRV
jgi:hypothetical protein